MGTISLLKKKNADFRCHSTETIIIDNEEVNIDKQIVKPIIKLNHLGCKTVFCCQGGNDSVAYISLNYDGEQFPTELIDVWHNKLKFYVNFWSVHANAPYGLNNYAAKAFCNSLNDWEQEVLDESGDKYMWKVKRPDSRPILPETQGKNINYTNKNLIENF